MEPAVGFRLVVAYDGRRLHGWQRQPGQRTVQGTLEEAVASMVGHPVTVRGAGRTDAGVHAHGQVAAFDTDGARAITPRGFLLGLNAVLPEDVSIRRCEHSPVGFEPRHDAVCKTYRYLLHTSVTRDPLLVGRAWRISRPIDLARMRDGASRLVGTHDFRAFRAADDQRDSTVRTLLSLDVAPFADELVAIEVKGTAFLKNMVRIIAGTLVEIGHGRRAPESLGDLLASGDRRRAGRTAPPDGLYLVSVQLGRGSAV